MSAPERLAVDYRIDRARLFASLRHWPAAVWLDSNAERRGDGAHDLISACPTVTLQQRQERCWLQPHDGAAAAAAGEFLSLLREQLAKRSDPDGHAAGAAIGYLGYDLARSWAHGAFSTDLARADIDLPQARIGLYDWLYVADHRRQQAEVLIHPACPPAIAERVRGWVAGLAGDTAPPPARFRLEGGWQSDLPQERYRTAFRRVHDYIEAGDCYQVNLAQRLSARYVGDPFEAYLRLRAVSPAPYAAFIGLDEGAILSLSPEQFLQVTAGEVTTRPIKGTRPRLDDRQADEAMRQSLLHSDKERAENVMIVDLLRNDLGKSCQPGSIRVPKLCALESFANVHHLVSTVVGRLTADRDALDLLRGCFPGGSITGAPKQRAMQIIEELEPHRRAIYCGSIAANGYDGSLRSSITIRTLLCQRGTVHVWGGGGIVADSSCEAEYQESLAKIDNLCQELNRHESPGN